MDEHDHKSAAPGDGVIVFGLPKEPPQTPWRKFRMLLGSALYCLLREAGGLFFVWIGTRNILTERASGRHGRVLLGEDAVAWGIIAAGAGLIFSWKYGYFSEKYPVVKWVLICAGGVVCGYGFWRMAHHFASKFQ